MSIIADRVARAPAIPAGTAGDKKKAFLPATRRERFVAVAIVLVATVAAMFPLAHLSGGRIGAVVVQGSSLHRIVHHGAVAIVLPLPCKNGDVVSAWAPHGLDQSQDDPRDQEGTYVLKVLHDGRLVSTDAQTTIEDFEIRGRVIAFLPLYKLTGAIAPEDYQNSRMAKHDPTPLEAIDDPSHPYNVKKRAERLARQQTILASSHKLDVKIVWTETEGRIKLSKPTAITCIRLSRVGCMVDLRQPTGLKLYLPPYAIHRAEWWSEQGVSAKEVVLAVFPERGSAKPKVWDVEVWAAR